MIDRIEFFEQLLAEVKAERSSAAKSLHQITIERLKISQEQSKHVVDQILSEKQNFEKTRKKDVAEFEGNLADVYASIATDAEKHNRKVAAAKKRLEDEKDDMIARGLNPYIEFRREAFEREAQHRQKLLKQKASCWFLVNEGRK